MTRPRLGSFIVLAAFGSTAPACSQGPGAGDSGAPDAAPGSDAAAPSDAAAGACTARVVIAFYTDSNCTAQVGMRSYDTSRACFSWTAAGSHAMENSATRFQCYRDRLCYTQVPNSLDCAATTSGQTDKQARTDQCLREPDGMLYSRILSGTEGCPVAPSGFECPTSAAMMGTPGVAACTTSN